MVLNIENDDEYTLRETNIPLPHPTPHDIVCVSIESAQLIVFGYCRNAFFSFEAAPDCASTRIKKIGKYFDETTIHWVARRECPKCDIKHNHYSITLDKILKH